MPGAPHHLYYMRDMLCCYTQNRRPKEIQCKSRAAGWALLQCFSLAGSLRRVRRLVRCPSLQTAMTPVAPGCGRYEDEEDAGVCLAMERTAQLFLQDSLQAEDCMPEAGTPLLTGGAG